MSAKTKTAASKTAEFQALYEAADLAGSFAAAALTPTPMYVGQPTTPLGSTLDWSKPVERVEGGVCGFAWVKVTPGTSAFAKWLKATKGAYKSYSGGVDLWVSGYGQSMQRKEAYATAFAAVLTAAGYTAYAQSRMD